MGGGAVCWSGTSLNVCHVVIFGLGLVMLIVLPVLLLSISGRDRMCLSCRLFLFASGLGCTAVRRGSGLQLGQVPFLVAFLSFYRLTKALLLLGTLTGGILCPRVLLLNAGFLFCASLSQVVKLALVH